MGSWRESEREREPHPMNWNLIQLGKEGGLYLLKKGEGLRYS